jgi:hypothetical protein
MVRHVLMCRSMKLPPSTVSTIIKNAYGIKQAVQHAATVLATQVNYFRSKFYKKWRNYCHMGGWLQLKKNYIPLTQDVITPGSKNQCTGLTTASTRSELQTYQSKCKKSFYFIKCNFVILITLKLFIYIKCSFYIHSIYFTVVNIIIFCYLCQFWDGSGM